MRPYVPALIWFALNAVLFWLVYRAYREGILPPPHWAK